MLPHLDYSYAGTVAAFTAPVLMLAPPNVETSADATDLAYARIEQTLLGIVIWLVVSSLFIYNSTVKKIPRLGFFTGGFTADRSVARCELAALARHNSQGGLAVSR